MARRGDLGPLADVPESAAAATENLHLAPHGVPSGGGLGGHGMGGSDQGYGDGGSSAQGGQQSSGPGYNTMQGGQGKLSYP